MVLNGSVHNERYVLPKEDCSADQPKKEEKDSMIDFILWDRIPRHLVENKANLARDALILLARKVA